MSFPDIQIITTKAAKNIVDILQPYVENLEKLTNLDGDLIFDQIPAQAEETQNNEAEIQENDHDKLLRLIASSPKKQITYTKLRSTLEWDRTKLDAALNSLSEKNSKVSIVQKNSRKVVVLS